mmetsp:Transcript_14255/g.46806  ORF Transcript_14255/g.46806 Transcript_14255/m.46806 type:complete len:246 (-) Transcript_14255:972-1709(-)
MRHTLRPQFLRGRVAAVRGRGRGTPAAAAAQTSLPSALTLRNLALFGGTVGPCVDALHNQCLLAYDAFPVTLGAGASSAVVVPLLAVAYPVLGSVLPRLTTIVVGSGGLNRPTKDGERSVAIAAVAATTCLIRASAILHESAASSPGSAVAALAAAAVLEWALLDRSWASLLAAAVAGVGGPLAELPFVAAGAWHYLPSTFAYAPLGGGDLVLDAITGPCYFAVTCDAIALGRWFDASETESTEE